MHDYDFGGWATSYNQQCSDGRVILPGAFKHQDGGVYPLVWNHNYDSPDSIIGKAYLKHTDKGVYAYGKFNDTDTAQTAKTLVSHGDITSLSIYANKLKQQGNMVVHGEIKEVSLVLAGANPGASIQEVIKHGEINNEEAILYNDEDELEIFDNEHLSHSEEDEKEEPKTDKTVEEVYKTFNDDQKKAMAIIIDQLMGEEIQNEDNEEDPNMKHNIFEQNETDTLSHSEILNESLAEAKKYGSLKESVISHSEAYGIEAIETLFPEAHNVNNAPEFIDRDQSWVGSFLAGCKKSPFSRLKCIYADITADEARALGYTKGNLKKEEVFGLLKRVTSPTTVYKKQKLDRDDILDITSFDVVSWIKAEMRGKLNEELARAILIGDGREAHSPDKIKETCIRPIASDEELFNIKVRIPNAVTTNDLPKTFIKEIKKAMADYEGAGVPNMYINSSMLSELLLIEDNNGRFIYNTAEDLAKTLGVKKIESVPVMKDVKVNTSDNLLAIIVNPNDYTIGADKGGQVSMFDDFDIDYNQQKYLMETRCSGSLLKPKTAITISKKTV